MTYQALARKWRPRTFSEIVSQEHVVRALAHALVHERIHHAYLFTGTRGVGKTTLARILAKALNCEARQEANPCGRCHVCREVDEGRFVDLIEVDAASRTKVEDTRELLDNVLYAPTQGRYKIYLIDEVHMLSGHSFNALLKTLEEPPPHVKFLLATTEPQKIPVTVLSRCLQFNLKRLAPDQIGGQMESILKQEGVPFELSALKALARAADGSMRDGLSLLDQAIAHGGGKLSESTVSAMLGTVSRQPVLRLLEAMATHDVPNLLKEIDAIAEHAPDYSDVLQQLLVLLHHLAIVPWVPNALQSEEDADRLTELAQKLRPDDVQLFYQIGLIGQRDLSLAPDARIGFEMVMLRMLTFRLVASESEPLLGGAQPISHTSPVTSFRASPARVSSTKYPTKERVNTHSSSPPHDATTVSHPSSIVPTAPPPEGVNWSEVVQSMGLTAMTEQLAKHCVLIKLDDTTCVLGLEPKHDYLRGSHAVGNLEKDLQLYFQRPLSLVIQSHLPSTGMTPAEQYQRLDSMRKKRAEEEIEEDETVRALKQQFGAEPLPNSITLLDTDTKI